MDVVGDDAQLEQERAVDVFRAPLYEVAPRAEHLRALHRARQLFVLFLVRRLDGLVGIVLQAIVAALHVDDLPVRCLHVERHSRFLLWRDAVQLFLDLHRLRPIRVHVVPDVLHERPILFCHVLIDERTKPLLVDAEAGHETLDVVFRAEVQCHRQDVFFRQLALALDFFKGELFLFPFAHLLVRVGAADLAQIRDRFLEPFRLARDCLLVNAVDVLVRRLAERPQDFFRLHRDSEVLLPLPRDLRAQLRLAEPIVIAEPALVGVDLVLRDVHVGHVALVRHDFVQDFRQVFSGNRLHLEFVASDGVEHRERIDGSVEFRFRQRLPPTEVFARRGNLLEDVRRRRLLVRVEGRFHVRKDFLEGLRFFRAHDFPRLVLDLPRRRLLRVRFRHAQEERKVTVPIAFVARQFDRPRRELFLHALQLLLHFVAQFFRRLRELCGHRLLFLCAHRHVPALRLDHLPDAPRRFLLLLAVFPNVDRVRELHLLDALRRDPAVRLEPPDICLEHGLLVLLVLLRGRLYVLQCRLDVRLRRRLHHALDGRIVRRTPTRREAQLVDCLHEALHGLALLLRLDIHILRQRRQLVLDGHHRALRLRRDFLHEPHLLRERRRDEPLELRMILARLHRLDGGFLRQIRLDELFVELLRVRVHVLFERRLHPAVLHGRKAARHIFFLESFLAERVHVLEAELLHDVLVARQIERPLREHDRILFELFLIARTLALHARVELLLLLRREVLHDDVLQLVLRVILRFLAPALVRVALVL